MEKKIKVVITALVCFLFLGNFIFTFSVKSNDVTIFPDGIHEKYAVLINGGSEYYYWNHVNFTYRALINDYKYSSKNIYLFNYDGVNPNGTNPDNMIDYSATCTKIVEILDNLSKIIDSDDLLFVALFDHGGGYFGPGTRYYGFSYSKPSVDPDDEQDYLEKEFKYRSYYTGRCRDANGEGHDGVNHGMGVWKCRMEWFNDHWFMYRRKYVSTFENVFFTDNNKTVSNADFWIEEFHDYLKGDFNRNGKIEFDEGEILDYDGDGNSPYDVVNDTFDEDDWGEIDYYINASGPYHLTENSAYDDVFFDNNTDNHVSVDINYQGGIPEVDGCDLDNQGLFDGIDINDDGDMDDWVSIDEYAYLYEDRLTDDELAQSLSNINAGAMIILIDTCFGGGFIYDLSAENRVIISSGTEEAGASSIIMGLIEIFGQRNPNGKLSADYDNNGEVSFLEVVNYYYLPGRRMLCDDNGDGIGHRPPLVNGSDGNLASMISLKTFIVVSEKNEKTPGFEIAFIVCAIALVLFWKRKGMKLI